MKLVIHQAKKRHIKSMVSTMMLGFSADPFVRWVAPVAMQYLQRYPELFKILITAAVNQKTAFYADHFRGVSVWLKPKTELSDKKIASALEKLGDSPIHAREEALYKQFKKFQPTQPYWYLPLIAVDPSYQGQGLGSKLMMPGLNACDASNQLAYLEASSDLNIAFYQRFGFEVVGKIQVKNSPPLTPMLRLPK